MRQASLANRVLTRQSKHLLGSGCKAVCASPCGHVRFMSSEKGWLLRAPLVCCTEERLARRPKFTRFHRQSLGRPSAEKFFCSRSASTDGSSVPSRALPVAFEVLGLKYLEPDALRGRFDEFDVDGSGEIDREEAMAILKEAEVDDTSFEAAEKLIAAVDEDKNKQISWEEFRTAVDREAEIVDKRIYPISACLGLHFTALGLQAPCLPLLARSMGLVHHELGLISAAGALVRISLNFPFASAADRFGRRPFLVCGPAIGAVGMVGLGMSSSFAGLAASSALLGFGGTAIQTGAGLYLNDISTPKNRARTTAPLMLTAIAGFSIGPAVGGVLAQNYGLQTPFLVCAGGMALASLSALATLPETMALQAQARKREGAKISVLQQWSILLQRPALQGIIANVVMGGFAMGAAPVSGVLYASEILGMTPSMIGLSFTCNVLALGICVPYATKLSDKRAQEGQRMQVMLPGMALQVAGLIGQSFSPSIESFVGCGIFGSIGQAFVMPNVSAFIMDNTSPSERAQALAMQRISQDVGLLAGASTMGFVAASMGVPFAMQLTAGLQAVAVGICAARAGPALLAKTL